MITSYGYEVGLGVGRPHKKYYVSPLQKDLIILFFISPNFFPRAWWVVGGGRFGGCCISFFDCLQVPYFGEVVTFWDGVKQS